MALGMACNEIIGLPLFNKQTLILRSPPNLQGLLGLVTPVTSTPKKNLLERLRKFLTRNPLTLQGVAPYAEKT